MMIRYLLILALSLFSFIPMATAGLPSVKLKDINGKSVDVARLSNAGKPIILTFFALWCKPCMRELTAIAEVYESWQKETGVMLVAVSIDDARSSDKVQAEVNARGFVWDVLMDTNSDLKRAMKINLIPYTLILDGKGDVVWKHSSYSDGGEEDIINKVRELVRQ